MILTRNKAFELLHALDIYCKSNKIPMPKNKSLRYIQLAKIVFKHYRSIALVDESTKFLCNSPKYLKKWALHESLRNISPLFYNIGYIKNL